MTACKHTDTCTWPRYHYCTCTLYILDPMNALCVHARLRKYDSVIINTHIVCTFASFHLSERNMRQSPGKCVSIHFLENGGVTGQRQLKRFEKILMLITHAWNCAALFEKIFVEKLKWMSAPLYMELFALGQCLPGPTSTQVQSGPRDYFRFVSKQ